MYLLVTLFLSIFPNVAPRLKTVCYIGLNFNTKVTPNTAAATARIIVLKSPERIKAMSKNVTKNINAVPKSPISASKPTQTAENTMNSIRFLLVCNLSSAACADEYVYYLYQAPRLNGN